MVDLSSILFNPEPINENKMLTLVKNRDEIICLQALMEEIEQYELEDKVFYDDNDPLTCDQKEGDEECVICDECGVCPKCKCYDMSHLPDDDPDCACACAWCGYCYDCRWRTSPPTNRAVYDDDEGSEIKCNRCSLITIYSASGNRTLKEQEKEVVI